MNAMFDVICSAVIGGIVLFMIVGFNSTIVEKAGAQTIEVIAQSNLSEVINILEYDFKKIGYRMSGPPDSSIMFADSNKIRFVGDFRNVGSIDTLIYAFDTTTASGKANPKAHILKRTSITQGSSTRSTESINLGITRFKLWYYRAKDTLLAASPTSRPSQIKSLKVAINIESTEPYKQTTMPYLKLNPGVYWERTIKPKNLR